MDSYLSSQQSTIFQHVAVLIYVFEADSNLSGPSTAEKEKERERDVTYYKACLAATAKYSPDASIFVLIHKMDLVRSRRAEMFDKKVKDLQQDSNGVSITAFGTSIWDESLYKAWSRIVHTLIPNASVLSKHLTTFAQACSATEIVMFERTTFLVIATSNPPSKSSVLLSQSNGAEPTTLAPNSPDALSLDPTRYERTSELIKEFKQCCSRLNEHFHSMELQTPSFTAVLDELTRNTYVMVIVHDPTIETEAIRMNIRLARRKFEELQTDSLAST